MTLPATRCSHEACPGGARVCHECVRAISFQWWGAIARHAAADGTRCELCELGRAEVCGEHLLEDVAEHRAQMRELGHRIGEPEPRDSLAVLAAGIAECQAQATRPGPP